jgi:hypothetical protein
MQTSMPYKNKQNSAVFKAPALEIISITLQLKQHNVSPRASFF